MSNKPLGNLVSEQLANIREQVTKVLEDTFTGSTGVPMDIYETDESIVIVSAALVGLNMGTLDISIADGHQITIEGETSAPPSIPPDKYLRRERRFGKFSRTLAIPSAVVPEQAKASFKENILTITLPKVPQSTPKVVKVTPD